MNYIIIEKSVRINDSGDDMKKVIEKLIEKNETISTMESCTGGALASEITNVEGSSEVFKFGAVTYSNEFKIKMGVDEEIINKYSVYSEETSISMAKTIANFTNSDYGIGITGKLNRVDNNNPFGEDNIVYICIYEKENNKINTYNMKVTKSSRKENKEEVLNLVKEKLLELI